MIESNRILKFTVGFLVFMSGICSNANAQTLFESRHPKQFDQYSDIAARKVGDLLIVLINENTDVENKDARQFDKSGNASLNATLDYGFSGDLGGGAGGGSFGQTSNSRRGFTGDSQFTIERQFQDRFTVSVVDVLPNGNLLISGKRQVVVQGDARVLKLSGIVRAVDVLPGNMVSSQLISNLSIQFEAEGPEQSFTKQGWLGRSMNRIWPF